MEKGWIKIKSYTNTIEGEMVKQMLIENGVHAVLLNKQDSSYFFGRIELYVHQELVEQAEALLSEYGDTNYNPTDVN